MPRRPLALNLFLVSIGYILEREGGGWEEVKREGRGRREGEGEKESGTERETTKEGQRKRDRETERQRERGLAHTFFLVSFRQ